MNQHQLLDETFIKGVRWHREIDSTNSYSITYAAELLATETLPFLVGTNQQTKGRGQGKNTWWAGDGALPFSVLLKPNELGIRKEQWPVLSLTVGLSVCCGLQTLFPEIDFKLKWPNDVFANGRKICGVLNETIPDNPELLVIGIGLNVNNSLSDAPVEIQKIATSLIDLVKHTHDSQKILITILNSLQQHCELLAVHPARLSELWKHNCFLTGMTLTVVNGTQASSGTCLGIDEDGALRIFTEFGEQRFFSGVVHLV